jgi:hypothetical protein
MYGTRDLIDVRRISAKLELSPVKDWSRNSPEGKLLREIFGEGVDE